jgi:8-oxo-dGTP diphosphatase
MVIGPGQYFREVNMKKKIPVAAALIREENKFLVCLRHKDDKYGNLWEFPGGKIEANETSLGAAVREMKEELGINVEAIKVLKIFRDEDQDMIIDIDLVECKIISGQLQALDCQKFGFYSLKEIEALKLAPADIKIKNYLKSI